ncbi:MAG: hypothetical protein QG656_471 [Candidatus Hydrogenedentes bacterium]|nr:hypothetical protein [Candidatus Hydrogenedentota bacterium]
MMPRQPEPEYMDLDHEAEAYALADFAEVNEAFLGRLLELAGGRPKAMAVDLGTGPGDIPWRVLRHRPRWHIVGADASLAMLRLAVKAFRRHGLRCHWVQCDAKGLPLASRAFDIVFSNSILHHLAEVGPFWTEVKRIGKPGAAVFLRDLARPEDETVARALVEQYAGNESETLKEEFHRSLLSAYTIDEVRAQLAEAGLDNLETVMSSDRHLDVFGHLPE